jgi:hypothetical protein
MTLRLLILIQIVWLSASGCIGNGNCDSDEDCFQGMICAYAQGNICKEPARTGQACPRGVYEPMGPNTFSWRLLSNDACRGGRCMLPGDGGCGEYCDCLCTQLCEADGECPGDWICLTESIEMIGAGNCVPHDLPPLLERSQ